MNAAVERECDTPHRHGGIVGFTAVEKRVQIYETLRVVGVWMCGWEFCGCQLSGYPVGTRGL